MKPFEMKKTCAVAVSLAAAIFLLTTVVPACSWDYLIWQNRDENSAPYYRFIKDHKAGFIDRTGKIVIKPTLRVYGNYQDGVINGLLKTGFDKYIEISTGKEVSKEFYDKTVAARGEWSADLTGLYYGFVDRDGKSTLEPKYPYARDFHEGLAAVVLRGPCAYYSSDGPCPSNGPGIFPRGAPATTENACLFTFIDKNGRAIADETFLDAQDFSEGLAAVRTEAGWGFIDKRGKIVIAPQFEKAFSFSDGLAMVRVDEKYGFIDVTGAFVVKPQFERAEGFSDGLAPVGSYGEKTRDNRFYFIDKSGATATGEKFLLASRYFKGVAHVLVSQTFRKETRNGGEEIEMRTQTFAYVNVKGQRIFSYTVEDEM